MRFSRLACSLILGIAVTSPALAGKKAIPPEAISQAHALLKSSPMYVEYAPYSKTIPHLYVGYSADGKVEQGIALRGFKTYEWVTALIVVKPQDGNLVVSEALVPDIKRIKKADKQVKVLSAITAIKHRVVQHADKGLQTIDAVTGATRYQNRIYLYYSRMAEALVGEMTASNTPALKKTSTLTP